MTIRSKATNYAIAWKNNQNRRRNKNTKYTFLGKIKRITDETSLWY
jgi:hypothetical protein